MRWQNGITANKSARVVFKIFDGRFPDAPSTSSASYRHCGACHKLLLLCRTQGDLHLARSDALPGFAMLKVRFPSRTRLRPALCPPEDDRLQQRTRSVPHDLYPDTDKNERRQAKDNIQCSVSHDAPNWLGKAIHQVDAA